MNSWMECGCLSTFLQKFYYHLWLYTFCINLLGTGLKISQLPIVQINQQVDFPGNHRLFFKIKILWNKTANFWILEILMTHIKNKDVKGVLDCHIKLFSCNWFFLKSMFLTWFFFSKLFIYCKLYNFERGSWFFDYNNNLTSHQVNLLIRLALA